jgi:polyketide cyclase/dehydrase/lipid transport protein
MARTLKPVGSGFTASAPLRLVFAGEVRAAPGAVFHALTDDISCWAEWFGVVTLARPLQDGAVHEIRLRGGARFRALVVAREPAERYAYRVTETNVPGVHAMLEEWRLAAAGEGTRIQWTIAADGTRLFGVAIRLARAGLGREFRRAIAALDRRLAAGKAEG